MAEQAVQISQMPLEQLNTLKEQMSRELAQITAHFKQLVGAHDKFFASKTAVEEFEGSEGKEVLVPLTSSMYVSGRIAAEGKMLIDVGTGYFLEKDVKGAHDFLSGKMKMLHTNLGQLEEIIGSKQQNLNAVTMMMQQKMSALKQR